jgi:hypothetical protein
MDNRRPKARRRKSIPDHIGRQVLIEAGYRCGVPTCRTILAIDLHHLVEFSEEGPNEPANLLALCPTCHALYHRGTIPREALYTYKLVLVSLSAAFDQPTIDLMLFLDRLDDEPHFFIGADTLVHFARLIGSDLATCQWKHATKDYVFHQGFRVSLSPKGRRLIEAWRSGNRLAVTEALSLSCHIAAHR